MFADQKPYEYLATKIAYDAAQELSLPPTIIVISGDLTETGKASEFKLAESFIDCLLGELNKLSTTSLSRSDVVIVPGNHDINYTHNRKAFESNQDIKSYDCIEKFKNYKYFLDNFYSKTTHRDPYDIKSGYKIYKFQHHNIAIIGFDSCRHNSHESEEEPGWIYQKTINEVREILDKEKIYPVRFGLFHHNPVPLAEFSKLQQKDWLASFDANSETLWKSGISILFHGHRHANVLDQLRVKNRKGKFLASVGAASLGRYEKNRPNHPNGYQIVELSTYPEKTKITTHPRELDMSPGASDIHGPGRFVDQPKPGCTTSVIKTSNAYIKEIKIYYRDEVKKQDIVELKTIDKDVHCSQESCVTELNYIRTLMILNLIDKAKKRIVNLKKGFSNSFDKKAVEILIKEIEIQEWINKCHPSAKETRKKWQSLHNSIDRLISTKGDKGHLIPNWVLKSQLLRIEIELYESSSDYWKLFREKAVPLINDLYDVYEQSSYRDFVSLYRRINVLIDINEDAHARQSLQEGIAKAPSFFPFYISFARLSIEQLRYDEALEHLKKAKQIVAKDIPTPTINFYMSLCYYFLGNIDYAIKMMEHAMSEWPYMTGFRNNYAFACTRKLHRDSGSNVWTNESDRARSLLDELLKSIIDIGQFGTAHFNYALLLFWAEREDRLELTKKVLKQRKRSILFKDQDGPVVEAFRRAKRTLKSENDYFHMAMASYYIERSLKTAAKDVRAKILDELAWDADNFFSTRYQIDKWFRALVRKNSQIKSMMPNSHFTTLKRWMQETQPIRRNRIRDGGGYFIKWNHNGIVFNPGAGFINNFHRRGYAITEIDVIIVSSDHYTGYQELRELIELINRSYIHRDKTSKVRILLHPTVFKRFPDLHDGITPSIHGPQVILPNDPISMFDNSIKINMQSFCDNCKNPQKKLGGICLESNMLCTLLELNGQKNSEISMAFVNASCVPNEMLSFLESADIIHISVGKIKPHSLFKTQLSQDLISDLTQLFNDDELFVGSYGINEISDLKALGKESLETHESCPRTSILPYTGIDNLIKIARHFKGKKKLIILGELSIDLADKRSKIAAVLNQLFGDSTRFVTEDIGLTIKLPNREILCEYEYRFVPCSKIDEECSDGDLTGPVKHFCPDHRNDVKFGEFLKREF